MIGTNAISGSVFEQLHKLRLVAIELVAKTVIVTSVQHAEEVMPHGLMGPWRIIKIGLIGFLEVVSYVFECFEMADGQVTDVTESH